MARRVDRSDGPGRGRGVPGRVLRRRMPTARGRLLRAAALRRAAARPPQTLLVWLHLYITLYLQRWHLGAGEMPRGMVGFVLIGPILLQKELFRLIPN